MKIDHFSYTFSGKEKAELFLSMVQVSTNELEKLENLLDSYMRGTFRKRIFIKKEKSSSTKISTDGVIETTSIIYSTRPLFGFRYEYLKVGYQDKKYECCLYARLPQAKVTQLFKSINEELKPELSKEVTDQIISLAKLLEV